MKIKHFQGYGTVNVAYEKFDNPSHGDPILKITVDGSMHEQGAVRADAYDIYRWLVERKIPGKDPYSFNYKLVGDYEVCVYYVYADGNGKVNTEECDV